MAAAARQLQRGCGLQHTSVTASLLVLCLALSGVGSSRAAPPGAYDLLPTGGASVAAGPGALPIGDAAAAFPSVRAIPSATPQPRAGACAASFALAQQCGGNMTNPLANCSMFNACSNVAWPGTCCPAASPCTEMQYSGAVCWTCGGKPSAALETAAANAEAAYPHMCTRMGPGGEFDYGCALGASMLFYEAQRSGRLPANNRIPWRGSSGLADVAPNGASIAGGWYDAGDVTRFTFPAAWSVATLALGFIEFGDAYERAGQTDWMLANLKWAADWLVAARYAPDAFVAVTWSPPERTIRLGHLYWGRPEALTAPAQVRALRAPMRGADLLGEGAAALAAVSMAFAERDPAYSAELLETARGLYTQATESVGLYSDGIPEVRGYYTSYSYIDDLAWAAAWLAWRTDDPELLREAKFYFDQHMAVEGGGEMRRFDYNNVVQGAGYILAKLEPSRAEEYSEPIRRVMDLWLKAESNITYGPKGFAHIDTWGNLRYVANQAFMGLLHNRLYPDRSNRVTVYSCFARKQARLMLGEAGQSYVVGVGNNPVCRPHHRGASCGPHSPAQPCDCSALFNPGCNPHTIYGALVGGPTKDDETLEDVRTNFETNEVAIDWNAGFTGLMAGLAASPVSWDQCKSAGLEDGRGEVSAALSGAAHAGGGGWLQLGLAAGAALLLARAPRA